MTLRRRGAAGMLAVGAFAAALAPAAVEPPPEPAGPAALGLALRRLSNLATVLFITAHPDDENNAVLTALSRGRGVRTALLTATRGEGGQNEIGPELGEPLGILRSEELAAIHRRDGVEQYFARAYDFGYSFSVEETYEKWGRDEILTDFVRTIRAVRPDVIVTLPRDARGGGQHHQAAGRLASIAFHAADDVALFPPETTGGLEPWQARRLYEGATGMGGRQADGAAVLETATDDALLGMSWFVHGGRSRTLHRTQGMAAPAADSGTAMRFVLVDSMPPVELPAGHGLLDHLDTSWKRLRGFAGERARPAVMSAVPMIEAHLQQAQAAFDPQSPARVLEPLRGALAVVRRLREEALVGDWEPRSKLEILSRLEPKEADLMEAIALAHGLRFEAACDDPDLAPGQDVIVTGTVENGGGEPFRVQDVVVHAPAGWTSERTAGEPRALPAGASASMAYKVRVGTTATMTRPIGRKSASADRYEIPEEERTGRVFPPDPLSARLFFTSGGLLVELERPVLCRASASATPRPAGVVPPFSVGFAAPVVVLPTVASETAIEVRVRYFGTGPAAATVRLEAPEGWTAIPDERPIRFSAADEDQAVRFDLRRPAGAPEAEGRVRAVVRQGEAAYVEDLVDIAYPHVRFRRAVREAELNVRTVDVRVPPDLVVGYVPGAGDRVAEALQRIGVRVDTLGAEDLLARDLSKYPTIVAGVRAYLARPELKQAHARVLEYVRGGGHVVVQYNKFELNDARGPARPGDTSPYAPYPAVVGTNRITDENAPLRVLVPSHPLLNVPNRINPSDFEGWVQERGLYFLNAADPRYEELLAATDPFPENPGEKKGMLVTAKVGAGRWTYVGLGLWRQLEAGVPGAYRILANLAGQPRPRP